MKTVFKLGLSILGLVIALVVVAGLIVINIDPNNHKDWIAAQFEQRTGHTLHLDGDVELTLYPWLAITVNDLSVGGAPGFDGPMLSIQHAVFRARLLSLLGGDYEIDTVVLHGMDAHLVTAADGRSNWADLTAGNTGGGTQPDESGAVSLGGLRLGGVDIEQVNLLYEDQGRDTRVAISDLRFHTGALVYGQPIGINLAFGLTSSAPALDADVSLQGIVNYDLENERYGINPLQLRSEVRGDNVPDGRATLVLDSAIDIDLKRDSFTVNPIELRAPDTQLTASLIATGVQGNALRLESQMDLQGRDLALLFKIAGIEPLASQLSELPDRSFTLQSLVSVQPASGRLNLAGLEVELLGSTLSGQVEAENLTAGAPVVRGNLTAAGPNLPSILEVAGQLTGGSTSKLAEGGRGLQQVDDKTFDINAEFDANLQAGSIDIPRLDIRMLGASVQGNLSAAALDTATPDVRGRLQAAGPDLPQLMQIGGWFQGGVESPLFQYGDKLNAVSSKAFSVNTEFDADLEQGGIHVPALKANAFGLQLEGNADFANVNNASGNVGGGLNLTGNNLRELLSALGQAPLAEVVQSISLRLEFGGTSNNLSVSPASLELVLSGSHIPNSPVTLALNAASRIDLERESLQVDGFSLTGMGLDTRGSITVSDLFTAPAVAGNVELARFNLRSLLQQLNQPVPDSSDPNVLQALAVKTTFSVSPTQFDLTDLEVYLDDTSLRGEFSILQSPAPEWRLDLAIDSLDVDRYLAAPQAGPASTGDEKAPPIPVETLRGINAKGRLDIRQLQMAGLSLADVSVVLDARDGRVDLSPLRSNLYQGSFEGGIALDVSQVPPSATVNVDLQQVAMEPLMLDMMNASYVSGRGNLQLDLQTRGADALALRQGLNGQGKIALEDGVLRGIDVAGVLTQLEAMIRSRRPAELSQGQQTAFDTFSATLAFNNGVVSSNDLLIRSPGFQVSGRGTLVNLNDDSIGYNLLTSVDAGTATRDSQEYNIGGYSVPIACSGTLSSPRCLPDASEILRNALVNEVRDRVGNLLQRAIGTDNDGAADTTPDSTQQDSADQLINRALDRLRPN